MALKMEVELKDDSIKDGVFKSWGEDSLPEVSGAYKNNVLEGHWIHLEW